MSKKPSYNIVKYQEATRSSADYPSAGQCNAEAKEHCRAQLALATDALFEVIDKRNTGELSRDELADFDALLTNRIGDVAYFLIRLSDEYDMSFREALVANWIKHWPREIKGDNEQS